MLKWFLSGMLIGFITGGVSLVIIPCMIMSAEKSREEREDNESY